MCVGCFGLVVSTCQVIGWKDPSEVRRLPPQSPGGRECLCVYFFVWFVYVPVCSPSPTQYIFHTPMTQYSLFVLKVSLNTNKTNKQLESALCGDANPRRLQRQSCCG